MPRIASLTEFWPTYLGEHRHPVSRALHFVGTTGFFVSVAASVASQPVWFPIASIGVVLGTYWGSQIVEKRRPAFLPLALALIGPVLVSPTILLGVLCAYTCAWIGHFGLEGNRPATFRYPVWSLLCDFRMWSEMARGRLWSGEPSAASPR